MAFRIVIGCVVAAFASIAVPQSISAQGTCPIDKLSVRNLEGLVDTPSSAGGEPLVGTKVELRNINSQSLIHPVTTNKVGRFTMPRVRAATYQMVAWLVIDGHVEFKYSFKVTVSRRARKGLIHVRLGFDCQESFAEARE